MNKNNGAPSVEIIIPNFNGIEIKFKGTPILELVLSSLKKTAYKNYTVFVSDDCSTDESINFVKKRHPEVKIIRAKKTRLVRRSCK
ncbi:MAG: glycosyltransferase family 2 protein [Caldisphaera sp.]